MPTTYNGKTGTAEGASAARGDPMGFYHGMAVKHGGKMFVIVGPPTTFVAKPERPDGQKGEAEQLNLFG
jgi:hypothetical protein